MLPFGSFEFFIIMAIFIAVILLCRQFLKNEHYRHVLFIVNVLFTGFVYPHPLHFIVFILYAYLFTYLSVSVFRFRQKIWGILLLLLPMLLVKFNIRFDVYPFKLNEILSFAGLSYASFRIVGYYMDMAPEEKITDFTGYFNFLAFTPTLLIGPIDRYSHFKSSQEKGFENINAQTFTEGWNALFKGIVFKYIIAECIDRYWLNALPVDSKEALPVLNTMYAYYFYLFFDFAGYSHMALGIGKMMGIEVPVNFTNPFTAINPQDFWRKFHISLGDWLKNYFFTPLYLFLTRKKSLKPYPVARQNAALFLTFLLMGCWNGFRLNFILSGALFGVYSLVHNSYIIRCKKAGKDIVFGSLSSPAVKYISMFIMFNLVAIALYIFSGYCPFI